MDNKLQNPSNIFILTPLQYLNDDNKYKSYTKTRNQELERRNQRYINNPNRQ
jgi:hypothetical protein